MFLSKLWFVSERIPPFLLFSTLIHEIVQTLVYHNDVQRKGRDGIGSTFSPDIYMVLCHVFGDLPLYYLDPPVVANEPRFQEKIKTFDTFILHDLWNL